MKQTKIAEAIGILDLLEIKGFDRSSKSKLVRHQDARWDLHDFQRRGWLQMYQSVQAKPVFDDAEILITFLGVGGRRSRFEGMYEVLGVEPTRSNLVLPVGMPSESVSNAPYHYKLRRCSGYEELENRVVIDWGLGTRTWVQRAANKPILEIHPSGQILKPFTDYLGFTLTHSELKSLVSQAEGNREWRARLSAVAGVYLILANDGRQYVGSAHGAEGLWGRWSAYAQNGHGGNKLLKGLVAENPEFPDAFSYSVLQILPRTATRAEVLRWEALYKVKLGSRAVGLNAN